MRKRREAAPHNRVSVCQRDTPESPPPLPPPIVCGRVLVGMLAPRFVLLPTDRAYFRFGDMGHHVGVLNHDLC